MNSLKIGNGLRLITIINSHHKSVMLWGRVEIELSDPVRSTAT